MMTTTFINGMDISFLDEIEQARYVGLLAI